MLLTLVLPGDIFGEDAMLIGGLRQSTAEVLREATLLIIPKELFAHFCNEHPESWRLLAELLARRQKDLEQQIELLIMRDVEQRILLTLAHLAEILEVPEEDGGRRSIHFSQGEIASMVGSTRETTSATLNALAKLGLVNIGRRKLVIADPNTLRLAADAPR